jgi:uncharacterized protein DUF929
MGKASRSRQRHARQRIAAQRAAARRARRRNGLLITGGSVLAVAAVVAALVLVKVLGGGSPAAGAAGGSTTGQALPASVSRAVTGVPAAALAAVGAGSVPAFLAAHGQSHALTAIGGRPLARNGRPEILYIGAEFCPYCAGMRWAMAVALGRFGTFSPLRGIHSAPSPESYPSTATLTFYRSRYLSRYLSFTPVEHQTVNHSPLQPLTAAQQQIWSRYQPDPRTRGYPFTDIGNRYLVTVLDDPAPLAGKTWSQIARALADPSSPIAKGVDGAANYLTAAICRATGNAPASVCTAPYIKSLQNGLSATGP